MTQQAKTLATKPGDWSSIPRSHKVEGREVSPTRCLLASNIYKDYSTYTVTHRGANCPFEWSHFHNLMLQFYGTF